MFSRKPLQLRAVFPHRTGQVRHERFCGICRQRACGTSLKIVQVVEVEGEQGAVLELRVAKEDLGKVIGSRAGPPVRSVPLLGAASSRPIVASCWKSWSSSWRNSATSRPIWSK